MTNNGAFTSPCGKGSNLPFNSHYLEPNRPKERGFQIIKKFFLLLIFSNAFENP